MKSINVEKKYNRTWWIRPVNLTCHEERFYKTCVQQLKEKNEELFCKFTPLTIDNFNFLLNLLKHKLERFLNRKIIAPEIRLSVN